MNKETKFTKLNEDLSAMPVVSGAVVMSNKTGLMCFVPNETVETGEEKSEKTKD